MVSGQQERVRSSWGASASSDIQDDAYCLTGCCCLLDTAPGIAGRGVMQVPGWWASAWLLAAGDGPMLSGRDPLWSWTG